MIMSPCCNYAYVMINLEIGKRRGNIMKGRESVNPILGRICITNNILKGHNKTGRVISTPHFYAHGHKICSESCTKKSPLPNAFKL